MFNFVYAIVSLISYVTSNVQSLFIIMIVAYKIVQIYNTF